MVKAKAPKKVPLDWREVCASLCVGIIRSMIWIYTFVSGYTILMYYDKLLLVGLLTETQKMTFDYSITMFTGCAIFLLLYTHEFDRIVGGIFNVKNVKSIKN